MFHQTVSESCSQREYVTNIFKYLTLRWVLWYMWIYLEFSFLLAYSSASPLIWCLMSPHSYMDVRIKNQISWNLYSMYFHCFHFRINIQKFYYEPILCLSCSTISKWIVLQQILRNTQMS